MFTLAVPTRGALAIGIGAGLWGLFWIPLRHLDDSGVPGLWSVACVTLTGAIAAMIIAALRRELCEVSRPEVIRVAVPLGLSTVLYFAGVLYSDVVRVVLLFYLLPVWTILAARILYGERVRTLQFVVIAAALVGLWLLLGGGARLPLPRNIGDACGLAAGFCWGVSLALLRGQSATPPYATTAATLLIAGGLAVVVALALSTNGLSDADHVVIESGVAGMLLPESLALLNALPLAFGFGAIILFPAMLGQIWGARLVPAPTAALLTMTEILVATVSATWLIGTELGGVSIAGGLLIVAAVLLDLRAQRASRRRPTPV